MLSALRIVGLVFSGTLLLTLYGFHRRKRLGNGEWLLGLVMAASIAVVAASPNSVNAILRLFAFHPGGGSRLIGLLVFSSLAQFFLLFVTLARSHRTEQAVDQLVRELAKREFRKAYPQSSAPIYVVLPAYNEAENVRNVLAEIPREVLGRPTRVLVIVDGATDQTEAHVRSLNEAAVSYAINRGGGSALRAGYDVAIENGAEIIVTMDADGQHVPSEIALLVQPILNDEADLVNGSRVLGYADSDDRIRTAGVVAFNWLCSLLVLRRITDCSNAFRSIRASALQRLQLKQVQFHTSEMLVEALKKGLRVIEVPVTIRRRQGGHTKKGPTVTYAVGFARALIGTWLR